ncbi:MarR family transcriptional regulator [Jeotgalibacillus sp. ET6]|uniref:MarR family winged helix-turn-helix transcriptional regulator n=1 Tax=Jeotgalibacillus sp. ET6 TaxID=3037260 RepID=UPI00241888C5|nr:winged helix DNA-binding protein [Jeotgalibacillus sp. ET6]MDG5472481.1 MarR family transcriptional regulator [Jeotgalibacillus sp. ET6]
MENFKELETFRYLILASQRQGNRMYTELLTDIGVTPSQAEVISVLTKYQPLSLKELGSLLICETGSPSRLIERMVKENLIERIKNIHDSRFVILQLTELGRNKHKLIVQAEYQMYEALGGLYSKEELQLVNQILRKFLKTPPLSSTLSNRGFI